MLSQFYFGAGQYVGSHRQGAKPTMLSFILEWASPYLSIYIMGHTEVVMQTTLFWKNEKEISANIKTIRLLGAGRAAKAVLVRVQLKNGEIFDCVEKIFKPGFLTRFIYWIIYQSPFPYQHSRDAISAAYYRRAVASKILPWQNSQNSPVAEPIYTRWDSQAGAFVLGAKYIRGRGIVPQECDPYWLRRKLYNYIVRPVARVLGKKLDQMLPPNEEVRELLSVMKIFEKRFRSSGLIGTGWQCSPLTQVSTANLLRTDAGYIMVDLESGIPAILVPYYLFRALLTFNFPYFDDLESERLLKYIERNRSALTNRFGEIGFAELNRDAEKLIRCSENWKKGEIGLFRNPLALFNILFSAAKKRAVLITRAEIWYRNGEIDQITYERLVNSSRYLAESLYLFSWIPGRLGRFLRKARGNQVFRKRVRIFISNRKKRQKWLAEWVNQYLEVWQEQGRFPSVQELDFGLLFCFHLLVSKLTSPRVHRFFVDRSYRKKVLLKIRIFFTSNQFQSEYSRFVVQKGFSEWYLSGRMSADEHDQLVEELNNSAIQEYIRTFVIHGSLKFFEPITSSIKLLGVGLYLATFAQYYPSLDPSDALSSRLLVAIVLAAVINPISVLMMVNTSIWRTLITLQRMLSFQRRGITYIVALFFGMIPVVGTMAYPVQMYISSKHLSIYLMRNMLSSIGQKLPIYGGKDSLTELRAIKTVNFIVEFIEIILWIWMHSIGGLLSILSRPFQQLFKSRPRVRLPDRARPRKGSRIVDQFIRELWSDLESSGDIPHPS